MKEWGKYIVFIANLFQPGKHKIKANHNQIFVPCTAYNLERNNYGHKCNSCSNFNGVFPEFCFMTKIVHVLTIDTE